jgi:hypothetical protein
MINFNYILYYLLYYTKIIKKKMELIKLTENNAINYIGYEIIFKTRNNNVIKRILGVSNSGKSIIIDEPHLNNSLQIVTRNVYVILS